LATVFAVSTRFAVLTIQNILGVVKCYSVLFGKKEVIREYRMIYRFIEDQAFSLVYDLAPPPPPPSLPSLSSTVDTSTRRKTEKERLLMGEGEGEGAG
jgi:hypothetical protein